jgi:hypothetical protein
MVDNIIASGADSEWRRYVIPFHHFVHFFAGRAFREAAGCIQGFGQKINIAQCA